MCAFVDIRWNCTLKYLEIISEKSVTSFPVKISFSVPVKLNASNDRIQLEAGPEEGRQCCATTAHKELGNEKM